MRDAALAIGQALQSVSGETVVYSGSRDGSEFAIELTATPGETRYEAINSQSALIDEHTSIDWLVFASELTLAGDLLTPESGDEIARTVGEASTRYQVMAPAGEPVWRYSDRYQIRYRIHTKRVFDD